jgi:perosamine synthetase
MTPAHQRLEIEWARANTLDPAGMVACSSGSAALRLAFEVYRANDAPRFERTGWDCVMSDYTMVMCARAVKDAGMIPRFIDCDDRLNLQTASGTCPDGEHTNALEHACAPNRVGAILAVHHHGRRCDMDAVASCARWRGFVWVVEDLAEAHGIRPHPLTDAACWSFYANKIVAGEEGGAVWFRDPDHAALARQLRSCGFTPAHDYTHTPRGFNWRLADCLAEKVLESLGRYHDRAPADGWGMRTGNKTMRRVIEGWYDYHCPAEWRMPAREAVWIYDLRIPGLTRDRMRDVVAALQAAGVAARYGFKPLSMQTEFWGVHMTGAHALRAYHEVFSLPVRPGETTEVDCRRAFSVIAEVLAK